MALGEEEKAVQDLRVRKSFFESDIECQAITPRLDDRPDRTKAKQQDQDINQAVLREPVSRKTIMELTNNINYNVATRLPVLQQKTADQYAISSLACRELSERYLVSH